MPQMLGPAVLALSVVVLGSGVAHAQGGLSAEDHAEIVQLYATYNLALDGGDAQGWADTFVEDGVFGNNTGRAALVTFAEGFTKQQAGHARHWHTNIHLTKTAEGAAGTCYLMLMNAGARPHSVIVTGTYHDTLVKTSDGWRFTSRQVEPDPAAESGQN